MSPSCLSVRCRILEAVVSAAVAWLCQAAALGSESVQTPQVPDKPSNLDFEGERIGGRIPAGWGGGGDGYSLSVDIETKHGGKASGRVRFDGPQGMFGTMTQCIAPGEFRGKRVQYSGYLKTDAVEQWAGMWMRVDGPDNRVLSFDNMQDRGVKGSTDWKRYEINLEVAQEATGICFGFLLGGKGTVWADDLKLELSGKFDDVSGQITDTDGKSVTGADVLIVLKTWPNNRYTQRAFAAKSDKEGQFRFADLYSPDARYALLVAAVADGYALESIYQLKPQGGKLESVELRLGKADPLKLKFQDAAGKPIKGVSVSPGERKTRDGKEHLIYVQGSEPIIRETDANGLVPMNHFQKGDKAKIRFRLPGKQWEEKELTIGDRAEEVIVTGKTATEPKANSSDLGATLSKEDQVRTTWLADHAVRMKSIQPDDEDFVDLEPLKKLIGDARIVQLGEQSHGDGASFHAKIRLVKFLHERMGFDVLAFESGLYDCHKAWERLRAGDEPVEAARRGIFGIWMQSEQVRPLAEYLGRAAKSERPLELCGFDCQFTASASRDFLLDDLKQFVDAVSSPVVSEETWATSRTTIERLFDYQYKPSKEERGRSEKALQELSDALGRPEVAKAHAPRDVSYWKQLLTSTLAQAAQHWQSQAQSSNGIRNGRDEQMARNLIWLANEYYSTPAPGRKIIVWAATFHIMRNPSTIEVPGGSVNYANVVTMGHRVSESLGDSVFTLGFTAYDGKAGLPWAAPREIGEAPAGSLEYLLARAGLENAIVSFRDLRDDGAWLRAKLSSRPLGYQFMRADWTNVIDGIVFTRHMTPSTRGL